MTQIWFTEPSIEDSTYANRLESPFDWLQRSTIQRAQECRLFLNYNLNKLPQEIASIFFQRLRTNWEDNFFELIVARTLQEQGAEISYEQPTESQKHPDFLARFPDGDVIVEAVAPKYNESEWKAVTEYQPLLGILEQLVPDGWSLWVPELPNLGPAASRKVFKKAATAMLSKLPGLDKGSDEQIEIEFEERLDAGTIHFYARRDLKGNQRKISIEPDFSMMDNSEGRIRRAVHRKRSQVRDSDHPVILAIRAGSATDAEQFDIALFGRTYATLNSLRVQTETGFSPSGEFAAKREGPPTFAGVLAFFEVGFREFPSPMLYEHPRFEGQWPKPIQDLHRRAYDSGQNRIVDNPCSVTLDLRDLKFVQS